MTDLAVVEQAIEDWVTLLSPGLPFEWGKQPMGTPTTPFVIAFPGVLQPHGWDERIWTYNPTLDRNDLTMIGVRSFTLTLSFRSFDQRLGLSSRQQAEDFRILTQSPSSIAFLNAADLALIETLSLVDTDYTYERRRISQVDLDFRLAFRYNTDDPLWDGSYIKTVEFQSQSYVLDEAGNAVVDENGDFVVDEPGDICTVSADD